MTDTKLIDSKSNESKLNESKLSDPMSNYNLAVVSHCPSQQTATIVTVEKPNVYNGILKNFGISNQNEKPYNAYLTEKRAFFILLFIVFVIFLCSTAGLIVMWFTEIYNDRILSGLILSHNSTAVEWWKKPPLDPELRIHLFNYTNIDRYMSGLDEKLKVEDIGPLTYREKFEKVNVTFNNNYTISYRENRSYKFLPEKSTGHPYDQITFPNIAFLTASSSLRYDSKFKQIGANLFLSGNKPFKTLTAHQIIWGYEEPILKLRDQFGDHMFGMLRSRNGTSQDVTTIFTGEDDIRKLSLMDRFNGEEKMNYWSTDECNRLDGSDGSQFPPHWMDKKQPLQVFIKSFCRKFPLTYDEEVNILNGIPALRYKAPLNVFSHPNENAENLCYCNIATNDCPPSGLFNASLCFDGAPIFSSFPHFFTGDPVLFENIEGLQPDEKKHLTYADIHPRLAFPIDGASRFQINVQVQKADWVTGLSGLKEGLYLPILWMEVTSGELPEELRTVIYHSTFSANAIQLCLSYGFILICAITLPILIAAFYYITKKR